MRGSLVFLVALLAARPVQSQVTLEYIAHASFVVESPRGVRVLIDPYNSWIWLGYQFPERVRADAVLISHAHYDHDAAYQLPLAPVFRDAGTYSIGDVNIRGVRGQHGGAASMRQRELSAENTIWVVEVGGIRIAHTGDNATLTAEEAQGIGTVDVLLTGDPVDVTSADKPARLLAPRYVIPMHYGQPAFGPLPFGLVPVDSLVRGMPNVVRAERNKVTIARDSLPRSLTTLVLPPSTDIRPWPAAVLEAQTLLRRGAVAARSGTKQGADSALTFYRSAVALAPMLLAANRALAAQLLAVGDEAEAQQLLERTLARTPMDDAATELQLRSMLARLYAKQGLSDLARAQYRTILLRERLSLRIRGEAEAYLKSPS